MKKTINIHIGGMPFIIDEEAYMQLHSYIETLKSKFSNENERNEIITDIEARIAEVFAKRLDKSRQVVNEEDVAFITSQLGKPEDIAGESEKSNDTEKQNTTGTTNTTYTSHQQYSQPGTKKLFRDSDNKIAGGVISGLCQYFGIGDPIWARIIFMLTFFAGFGTPFLVYFIFWLIIPEAKTTADKLQMRGEPVTLETIEKEVRDTVGRATDAFNRPVKDSNIVGKVGTLMLLIIKGFLKFISAFIFLGCLIAMIAFLGTMFGVSFFGMKDLSSITNLVLDNRFNFAVGAIGLFLTVGIPLFLIMYACGRFIASSKVPVRKQYIIPTLVLWIIGVAMFAFIQFKVERNFRVTENRHEPLQISQPKSDTLSISSFRDTSNVSFSAFNNNDESDAVSIIMDKDFLKTENGFIVGQADLELLASQDSLFHFEKVISATGRNKMDANKNIDLINYRYIQTDTSLELNSLVEIFKSAKFRRQTVKNKIYIPTGKFVLIAQNNQLDISIQGENDYDSDDVKGKVFTTKNGKVVCTNCLIKEEADNSDMETEEEKEIVVNNSSADSVSIETKSKNEHVHIHVGKNGVHVTSDKTK